MKIITSQDQLVSLKYLNTKNNKHFLSMTAMLYFDMNENNLISSRNLSKDSNRILNKSQALDEGYPKKYGEFVAYGSFYANNDDKVEVGQASISVGDVQKSLEVVGNRQYTKNFFRQVKTTEIEKFNSMKLSFENAYGGELSASNPVGKGFVVDDLHDIANVSKLGQSTLFLNKDKSMVAQSFEPLNSNWEYRAKKAGTFDENWQNTRWPHFPLDVNEEYFNTTLSDQWLDGYFKGDEKITIQNMNPYRRNIQGNLPGKTIKTFVKRYVKTKDDDYKTEFIEVENKLDTIVIFVEFARIAICYRGLVECADDQYSNIISILFVTEDIGAKKKDLQHYKDLMDRKKENEERDILKDELLQIHKKGMEKVSDIPLVFHKSIQELKGNTPKIESSPTKSLQEAIKNTKKTQKKYEDIAKNGLADSIPDGPDKEAILNSKNFMQQDNKARNAYAKAVDTMGKSGAVEKYQSMLDMPNTMLENFKKSDNDAMPSHEKSQLAPRMSEELKRSKLSKTEQLKINSKMDKLSKEIDFKSPAEIYEEKLANNPDDPLMSSMIDTWNDAAMYFVGDCKKILENNSKKYDELTNGQFRSAMIDISAIGYNEEDITILPNRWIQPTAFDIKKGFVIPYFEKDKIVKIAIRENITIKNEDDEIELAVKDNDIIIDGSKDVEQIIEGQDDKLVIVTDDIVKAWLYHQELYDIATIVVFDDEKSFNESVYLKDATNCKIVIYTTFLYQEKLENIIQLNQPMDHTEFLHEYKIDVMRLRVAGIQNFEKNEKTDQLKTDFKRRLKNGSKYIPKLDRKNNSQQLNDALDKEFASEYKKGIEAPVHEDIPAIKKILDKTSLKLEKLNISSIKKKEYNDLVKINDEIKAHFDEMDKIVNSGLSPKLAASKIENLPLKQSDLAKSILSQKNDINTHKKDILNNKNLKPKDKEKSLKLLDDIAKSMDSEEMRRLESMDIDSVLNNNKSNNDDNDQQWVKDLKKKGLEHQRTELTTIGEASSHLESVGNFTNCIIVNIKFNRVHLSKVDFSNSILENVTFYDSKIDDCVFANCKMLDTIIDHCEVKDTSFDGILGDNFDLIGSIFKNISFKKATINVFLIENCGIESVNFTKTTLSDVVFDTVEIKNLLFSDATLINYKLVNSVIPYASISKTTFTGGDIISCDFSYAKIGSSVYNSTSIANSKFNNSIIMSSYINSNSEKNQSISYTQFKECLIKKTTFSASLYQVEFTKSLMRGSSFAKSFLTASIFYSCDLSESSMSAILIEQCDFKRANLANANFGNSKIENVDMTGANLFGANLRNIEVNKWVLKDANIKNTFLAINDNYKLIKEIIV